MPELTRTRPGTMRLVDAVKYRLPLAGVVSILHRASGLLMFVLLPFIVWLFDTCLLYTSPSPRDRTRSRMPSSA